MKTIKSDYSRLCPKCGEEHFYSTKSHKARAENGNTNCKSCVKKGKNNPMYGKSVDDIWIEKHGKEEADKREIERSKKISESLKGRKITWSDKISESRKGIIFTEEHRKNLSENHSDTSGENNAMYGKSNYYFWNQKFGKEEADKRQTEFNKSCRLSTIKRIEINKLNGGQLTPGYNPIGCDIINWYNMYYDFNFQHAENGGEVCIDGYFPDGVDETRKIIIEIDEKYHFNSDGKLRQKDIQRQRYLEGLGYKFIRVRIE